MFSKVAIGILCDCTYLPGNVFFQIQSYRYIFLLESLNSLEKGSLPNNAMQPCSLMIRLYCFHSLSNGSTTSHLFAVIPYGRSQRTKSTPPHPEFVSLIQGNRLVVNQLLPSNFPFYPRNSSNFLSVNAFNCSRLLFLAMLIIVSGSEPYASSISCINVSSSESVSSSVL